MLCDVDRGREGGPRKNSDDDDDNEMMMRLNHGARLMVKDMQM